MERTGQGKVWAFTGGAHTIVILTGDIDASMTEELGQAVQTAEVAGAQVQVDASGLTFMDSAGVTALARLATRTPGPLIIFEPPEMVRFLLEVTALGEMVDFRCDEPMREPR